MRFLFDLLLDPSQKDMDIDGEDRLSLHSNMLERKRMIREVFTEFHHLFRKLDRQFLTARGLEIELGSGVFPMRNTYPGVLATDIVSGPHLDRLLDAENMDLKPGSVRVFFGQNCFHHFSRPDRFFQELNRILTPGGGAILLEPYHGPFATFLCKRLFRSEGFDKTYPSWETPVIGPMNGANQALSYLVFVRDRTEFERRYPFLKIVHLELVGNYLKYLLSGGLNFKKFCPDILIPVVDFIQRSLSPLNHILALHHVVVIRKES